MILDLFAGAGGWEVGLAPLGRAAIGIEWDRHACATRAAAELTTIRADVTNYPRERFAGRVEGLIASPPCQDFSVGGLRAGLGGDRGRLVMEVLRWTEALRPRWIACEQVPPVLPIWRSFAETMGEWGYRTWTGILNAADFGIPQVRNRAILMASMDPFDLPQPTHSEHAYPGAPTLDGQHLKPWVSMGEACGWPAGTLMGWPRGARGGTFRRRALFDEARPAQTITTGARDGLRGLPSETGAITSWKQSDDPGLTFITPAEGSILQGFPVDYPWQGNRRTQFCQIGNAFPPPVAAAVLGALTA